MKTKLHVIAAAAVILILSTVAFAADSGASSVSLTAKLNPVLTVSVSSGTMDFGTLTPTSANNTSTPVTITTTWVLGASEAHVKLYSYFTGASPLTSTAATGSQPIPFAAVQAKANAGAYTAFSAGGPYSTESFLIHDYAVSTSAANNTNSPNTDTLTLKIDMTNLTVPADTYSGTMYIQAQAN